jgi:puromycin-sensitive aminopeptidase
VVDAISYCKGGSVVRMAHAVLGEAKFIEGLRQYMKSFAYGNARTDDLWGAWEDASGKPIRSLMGQWTTQMGFPLLELVEATAAADGTTTLKLRQSHFLADGSVSETPTVWTIPIFAVAHMASGSPVSTPAAGGEAPLMPAESEFTVSVQGSGEWVKLNAGQHVPLRVQYPATMIPKLADAVRNKAFCAADRIGFLSDQSALATAGKLDPAAYLEILSAYAGEDYANVWGMMLERLNALRTLFLAEPELEAPYRSFARSLLLPKVCRVAVAII